jgi:transcriptional regulator with XRE-family HTH domain
MCVAHNETTAEQRFGEHVRQGRQLRGWTQESLARHLRELGGLDLDQSAIARLETGKRAIRFNEVAAISHLLELDLTHYSGFGRTVPDGEYEQAKAEADQRRQALVAAEKELAELRERFISEQFSAVSRLNIATNQLAALEAGIFDYEMRHGQRDEQGQPAEMREDG